MMANGALAYLGRRWRTARQITTDAWKQVTLAGALAMAALLIFSKFTAEIGENGRLTYLDHVIHNYFYAHQAAFPLWLRYAMRLISDLAAPQVQFLVFLWVAGYFLLSRRRWFPEVVTMVIGVLGGALLVVALKHLLHRPRPEMIFAPLGYSFPSGHSFFAFVVYGMTAYWLSAPLPPPRRRVVYAVATIGILLVGFSRVFLGEHYPSDVGAGFALASAWVYISLRLPVALWQARKVARGNAVPPATPGPG
jgi:undecaprenyl-diphosphatase